MREREHLSKFEPICGLACSKDFLFVRCCFLWSQTILRFYTQSPAMCTWCFLHLSVSAARRLFWDDCMVCNYQFATLGVRVQSRWKSDKHMYCIAGFCRFVVLFVLFVDFILICCSEHARKPECCFPQFSQGQPKTSARKAYSTLQVILASQGQKFPKAIIRKLQEDAHRIFVNNGCTTIVRVVKKIQACPHSAYFSI